MIINLYISKWEYTHANFQELYGWLSICRHLANELGLDFSAWKIFAACFTDFLIRSFKGSCLKSEENIEDLQYIII